MIDLSRRQERLWIRGWLAVCAVVVAVVFGWGVLLNGFDEYIERLDDRWVQRLDAGEALVEAGRFEEAAKYLNELEKHFPAEFVKHHLTLERERLYRLLGRSYSELGRKTQAIKAYNDLTEYDPRNWVNWELLAEAHASFGELELASDAELKLLSIHPNHLPTVDKLVRASAAAGKQREAIEHFTDYLDAFCLARITMRLGTFEQELEVPADARPHAIDLPLSPVPAATAIELELGCWSAALGPLTAAGPQRVGEASWRPSVTRTPDWSPVSAHRAGNAWSSESDDARLTADLADWELPDPLARLAFKLTAYKPVTPELWQAVERAYAALGDDAGLARTRARVVVGGCPQAGSIYED